MRKRKVGRPKGSKSKPIVMEWKEVSLSPRKTITISTDEWCVSGTGNFSSLHQILNQLEGK